MEKHLTQTNLEKYYRKELRKLSKNENEDIFTRSIIQNNKINENHIFLSHCHQDKTIVAKIHLIFKNLDTRLYIDWMDHSMPLNTNKATASIIKNKIDSCRKFIFLATYRALASKWCNWELGLAFSSKGEKDFAILPIESRSGKWPGNEYLHLYPEMKINTQELQNVSSKNIKIEFTDGREISFEEWLLT